jgi:hypothetical protein
MDLTTIPKSLLPAVFRLLLLLGGTAVTAAAITPGTYSTETNDVRIIVGTTGKISSVTVSGGDDWMPVSWSFSGTDLKGNGTDEAWGSWDNVIGGTDYTNMHCEFTATYMGGDEFAGSFAWSYKQKIGSTIHQGSGGDDYTATLRFRLGFDDPATRTVAAAGAVMDIGLFSEGIVNSAVTLSVSGPVWMHVSAISWSSESFRLTVDSNSGGRREGMIMLGYYGRTYFLSVVQPAVPLAISVQHPVGTTLQDGVRTVDFGFVALRASNIQTFTVTNTGTAALSGLAIAKSGSHPGDFVVVGPGINTLAPGASTTFSATFKPSATGIRYAGLQITSSDLNKDPFDITLEGAGIAAPEITIEQPGGRTLVSGKATFNFGSVMIEMGRYVTKTFTIRNTGTAGLGSIGFNSNGGGWLGAFLVQRDDNNLWSLAPGKSTTFSVTFYPELGSSSETLQIRSNDSARSPFEITLTGEGIVAPDIAVEQTNSKGAVTKEFVDGKSKMNFGTAKAGKYEHFWVRNEGNADLTGISIALIGKQAKDFYIIPSFDEMGHKIKFPKRLTRRDVHGIGVGFRPRRTGACKAILRIKSNDKDESPFDIILTGKGVATKAASSAARLPSWSASGGAAWLTHDIRQFIGTVQLADGRRYLTLTVIKPSEDFLPTRSVEVSSNLIDWYCGSKHTTIMTDDAFLLKVRDNAPLTPGTKRYIRMKER